MRTIYALFLLLLPISILAQHDELIHDVPSIGTEVNGIKINNGDYFWLDMYDENSCLTKESGALINWDIKYVIAVNRSNKKSVLLNQRGLFNGESGIYDLYYTDPDNQNSLAYKLKYSRSPLYRIEATIISKETHLNRNKYNRSAKGRLTRNSENVFIDECNEEWELAPISGTLFHDSINNIKFIHKNDKGGEYETIIHLTSEELIKRVISGNDIPDIIWGDLVLSGENQASYNFGYSSNPLSILPGGKHKELDINLHDNMGSNYIEYPATYICSQKPKTEKPKQNPQKPQNPILKPEEPKQKPQDSIQNPQKPENPIQKPEEPRQNLQDSIRNPQEPKQQLQKQKKVKTTLFLIDLSGSMSSNGGESIPKIEQAKNAARSQISTMKQRQEYNGVVNDVAVFGFEGSCSPPSIKIKSEFSTDLDYIETIINKLRTGGGTPLFKAITESEKILRERLEQKNYNLGKLIILSDGEDTCDRIRPRGVYSNSKPLQEKYKMILGDSSIFNIALSDSVIVKYNTVGFNVGVGSSAERDLQYLAQSTGGKYLNAKDNYQLKIAFKRFNRDYIPKLNSVTSKAASDHCSEIKFMIESELFRQALTNCENYVKEYSDDPNGYYNLALMQEANDYYSTSIINYQKYLSLNPNAADKEYLGKQIENLKEESDIFINYQSKVLENDLKYIDLHFKKIQNGQSIRLAEEFKGFLIEKVDYYRNLPKLMGRTDRLFKNNTKQITNGLESCARAIYRNPETWDRDATPYLSMIYLNLERLIAL